MITKKRRAYANKRLVRLRDKLARFEGTKARGYGNESVRKVIASTKAAIKRWETILKEDA